MMNEAIVDQFSRIGARVLTADGADLTTADGDPTRILSRQVLGAVAQFEKSVIVLKLRQPGSGYAGGGRAAQKVDQTPLGK